MKDSDRKPDFSLVGTDGPISRAFDEVHKMLREQTAHFDKRLNVLQEGFSRLNSAVTGDETMGQEGIVRRLMHVELIQQQHNDKFRILPVLWKVVLGCVTATISFIAWAWDRISVHLK